MEQKERICISDRPVRNNAPEAMHLHYSTRFRYAARWIAALAASLPVLCLSGCQLVLSGLLGVAFFVFFVLASAVLLYIIVRMVGGSRPPSLSSSPLPGLGSASELHAPAPVPEEPFRALLESAPDAMVVVDEQGTIVLVNAQTERMFGYTRQELLGKRVEHLIPSRFGAAHKGYRKDFFHDPRTRPMGAGLNLKARRKEGSEFPVEISLSPMKTGGAVLVTAAIRDVTDRREAEERTSRLNQDLQRRTSELEATNHELEAFTYSVSHDLRAPLRHVDGYSRLIQEDAKSTLSEDAQLYATYVRDGTRQMAKLIDDLLELSRIGRKDVRLQVTSINALVDEAIKEVAPGPERRIEWHVAQLGFAACDAALVKQVFVNLLANAVKFTAPRERAVIQVGVEAGPVPTFFVQDNGVGFSMKYADKLFGIFQRLHRAEDFEGTGVGLAIVQRIISKHGGTISAEAELDKGAKFSFTLAPSPSPEDKSSLNEVQNVLS